jgi:HPr kinase/phosphorylase
MADSFSIDALIADNGHQQTIHGTMLAIDDHGVLLTGRSGIGKSAIALELISRGHALVADDAPVLHRIPDVEHLIAVCPPPLADMLEVRALGILNVGKLFGPNALRTAMPVQLVVELVETITLEAQQRLSPYEVRANILGMDIPFLQLPIGHATNLAVLVETVTRNHVLYKNGYNAANVLNQRQQHLLSKQTV